MITCNNCGQPNDDDARVCTSCGVRLRLDEQATPNTFQPPPIAAPSSPPYSSYQPPAYAPPNYVEPNYPPPPPMPPSAYNSQQYGQYQPANYPPAPPQSSSNLSTIGMALGIVAISVFLMGLVPCLGWLNWINLPLAGVTIILCIVAMNTEAKNQSARSRAIIGVVFGSIALTIGFIRLIIGGGCV